MSNQKKTCPICPNHCAEDALHCEKGKSYFRGGQGDNRQQGHFHKGRHGGRHEHGHEPSHGKPHGYFDNHFSEDGLPGVFMQCGHHLFRCLHEGMDDKEMFYGLSDSEKEELKGLLTKLLDSWNGKDSDK